MLSYKGELSLGKMIISLILALSLGFLGGELLTGQTDIIPLFQSIAHGIWMSWAFIIFWFTDRYAKNKIGYFTIIIYWLGLEYGSLYVPFLSSEFILARGWSDLTGFANWMTSSGSIGLGLWFLIGNILFFYVFFQNLALFKGKFRWLSFIYSIALLCLPIAIGYFIYPDKNIPPLSVENEYLGRTALLFSVLLICYGFVKRQVKQ